MLTFGFFYSRKQGIDDKINMEKQEDKLCRIPLIKEISEKSARAAL